MKNIVNGLIAQFMISVRRTGLGLFPAFITSEKSIFTMMGYIMKKRQIAMGIETWWKESLSRVVAIEGAILPRPTPAIIHRKTQSVRYFSKILKVRPFLSFIACSATKISYKNK